MKFTTKSNSVEYEYYAIDFPDWPTEEKISYLQRRVIVHSILYYSMNESVISDRAFDAISRQLVDMMESTPIEVCEKSRYWYCMYNFDGNTGFDLYSRLTKKDRAYLSGIARLVLSLHNDREYQSAVMGEGEI